MWSIMSKQFTTPCTSSWSLTITRISELLETNWFIASCVKIYKLKNHYKFPADINNLLYIHNELTSKVFDVLHLIEDVMLSKKIEFETSLSIL